MCIYLYTSLSPYSRASLPARFLEARADPNQKDGRNNTSSLARVSSCVLEGPEKQNRVSCFLCTWALTSRRALCVFVYTGLDGFTIGSSIRRRGLWDRFMGD